MIEAMFSSVPLPGSLHTGCSDGAKGWRHLLCLAEGVILRGILCNKEEMCFIVGGLVMPTLSFFL